MARANPARAPVAPPICRTASWCWARCSRGRWRAGSGSQRRPPPVKRGTQSGHPRAGSRATSGRRAGSPTIALRLRTSSAVSSPPLPRRRSARRQKSVRHSNRALGVTFGSRNDRRKPSPQSSKSAAWPSAGRKTALAPSCASSGTPPSGVCLPRSSVRRNRPPRTDPEGVVAAGRVHLSRPGRRDLGDPTAGTPRPRPLLPAYTARGAAGWQYRSRGVRLPWFTTQGPGQVPRCCDRIGGVCSQRCLLVSCGIRADEVGCRGTPEHPRGAGFRL